MLLSVLLLGLLLLLPALYLLFQKRARSRRYRDLPPGPGWSVPLIGHLYKFDKDPIESLMKLSEEFGGLYLFDFGPTTAAIMTDYEYIEQVFN